MEKTKKRKVLMISYGKGTYQNLAIEVNNVQWRLIMKDIQNHNIPHRIDDELQTTTYLHIENKPL